MQVELFEVKFVDRDAAKLVYREIVRAHESLGISGYGMESYKTKSKRSRNRLKIILAVENSQNLQCILKAVQNSLSEHPLYEYLSFDNISVPLSQMNWNFDSYDDANYQKIFIIKRQKG